MKYWRTRQKNIIHLLVQILNGEYLKAWYSNVIKIGVFTLLEYLKGLNLNKFLVSSTQIHHPDLKSRIAFLPM